MKKIIMLAVMAALIICMGMAGSVFAITAASADITLTATVSQNCSGITANPLNLAVDPTTLTEVGSTGSDSTVQCTSGTTYTVTAHSLNANANSNGSGVLSGTLKSGTSTIPYTLYVPASFAGAGIGDSTHNVTILSGAGSSAGQTGAVVSQVAANAAQAGTYSDTVTLTVSY